MTWSAGQFWLSLIFLPAQANPGLEEAGQEPPEGTVLALQDALAALKRWRSRDGATPCWHWGAGTERMNPTPCSAAGVAMLLLGAGTSCCCWDTQLCGQLSQAQRTKGLTVPNGRSLPQPFLCSAHPVFRFQATYLSNL